MADEPKIAPFSELLLQQRGGALHAEASDALHDLVEAIEATGRGGELRIVLKIKPIGQGRQVTVNVLHSGDIYRFDGWEKFTDTAGSSGGGTWSTPRADGDPHEGTKSGWIWRYEAVSS